MKHSATARGACSRLLRWLRRGEPGQDASVHEEMHCGSLIGMLAGLLIAALLVGSPLAVCWGAAAGAVLGALIGLVLWLGAEGQPEDPVLPPAREQARRTGRRR